jgi:hypothetical protein
LGVIKFLDDGLTPLERGIIGGSVAGLDGFPAHICLGQNICKSEVGNI